MNVLDLSSSSPESWHCLTWVFACMAYLPDPRGFAGIGYGNGAYGSDLLPAVSVVPDVEVLLEVVDAVLVVAVPDPALLPDPEVLPVLPDPVFDDIIEWKT